MVEPTALYDLFKERQSDRKFDLTKPVEEAVLHRIVEAACMAPSAVNQQPWHVVAVCEREAALRVGKAAHGGIVAINKFTVTAPAHLFIVGDAGNIWARIGGKARNIDFAPFDIGIFIGHLVLAIEAEGLGSCIIGSLNGEAVAKELGIPANKRVLFDIVVGHPLEETRNKRRRPINEVLHIGKW